MTPAFRRPILDAVGVVLSGVALAAAAAPSELLQAASAPAFAPAQPAFGPSMQAVPPTSLATPKLSPEAIVKPGVGPGVQAPTTLRQTGSAVTAIPKANARVSASAKALDSNAAVTAVGKSTGSTVRKQVPHVPAVPRNLRNSSGVQDCAAHLGLIGALVCPDLIRSGRMLLIWDWQAGAGPDAIDGYRMYRVDGKKQLIYTRADKKDLTLVDVPLPAAGYVGTCYSVSAYAGAFESALSPAFCPTRGQTMVAATPTIKPAPPPPRAPNHVDIHVTEDSYPMDTVVAAGGSVTWINDDSDAHSVYGWGGSWSGELDGHGGRYTATFRDIGQGDYIVSYTCEYHANMVGRIRIVVNR